MLFFVTVWLSVGAFGGWGGSTGIDTLLPLSLPLPLRSLLSTRTGPERVFRWRS